MLRLLEFQTDKTRLFDSINAEGKENVEKILKGANC